MTKTLILGILLLSSCVFSQGYIIENFDINIELSRDGYYNVEETIEVDFLEKRRGIFRNIPKKYKINGKSQNISLSKIKVKDHEYKRLSEGNDYIIRIGQADKYLTGKHKYQLSYRIANAFIYADDHIAFQYNLVSGWDTEIKKLSYRISLPDDLSVTEEDVSMMTGAAGERNKHVSLSLGDKVLTGRSLTSIPAEDNATIALKLPLGYVAKPVHPFSLAAAQRKKGWLIPLLLSMLTFGYYRARSKSEPLGEIEDHYFSPENFSPPIVGAYYDNKVNTEDIISLLPYWANQGYVKILTGPDVLYFKKIKALPDQLPYFQKALFDKIFENEDLVMLEELNTKLGAQVAKMKNHITKDILQRALLDTDNYNLFHKGLFLVMGIVLCISAVVSGAILSDVFLAVSLAILGLVLIVIHASQPKLSEKGLRIKRELLGLKQFLKNGDQTKMSQLIADHPDYIQQMYPYAIAFGIDKTWIRKMDEMNIPPPAWYDNYNGVPNGLNTVGSQSASRPSWKDFSNDLNIPVIASVFTSFPQPAPGSGSSSSGGGFSGGGAGGGFGGGGGSW